MVDQIRASFNYALRKLEAPDARGVTVWIMEG